METLSCHSNQSSYPPGIKNTNCVEATVRNMYSEIDNDAYCVCTHDFSPCTHRNIRPVRTMYAVKISGTQTVYDLMRTQIKIPLKLSQNDNLLTSIMRLLCQQSKSSYNMNAASDRFILHTMQYIMYLQ